MVERQDIVFKEKNGQNSPLPPTHKVQDRQGKSKSDRWKWLGFQGKTLWDLANLLLVPLLLLVVGFVVNEQARQREEYALEERKNQEVMQNYLSKMTDLISSGKLFDKNEYTPKAARALTQSVLEVLVPVQDNDNNGSKVTGEDLKLRLRENDAQRQGQVLSFLYDARLINYDYSAYKTKPNDKSLKSIIDMEGMALYEANLQNMELGPQSPPKDGSQSKKLSINLGKANLTKAMLTGATLNQAYLEGARLNDAKLIKTKLKDATLKRADLTGADLTGANLEGADLTYANLTKAILKGTNLSKSPNSSNALSNAQMNGADLTGADLRGANLANADLKGALLNRADLRGANLKNTDMREAKFCETTMPEGTVDYSSCPK
ncbi:pentapeptide repeat-containing protein [Nostoc sp. ATCC 53789]|uniref:pentapeptide repeat-containing protein n=1 Tax=Nostoc sp. ATCC 53789 TaxID=76335 RepID=UPI000DECC91A|nr:pentapeptide repeat-containing protein [Nostoc sp. ATCC 53789]QHG20434.1 hypothetical protein GJB62_31495 [Nostoc sp. ATCC 53789]RCJ15776.1 hypothetical protein A6V25_32290 [Nostoc sp. ATCC 53789]